MFLTAGGGYEQLEYTQEETLYITYQIKSQRLRRNTCNNKKDRDGSQHSTSTLNHKKRGGGVEQDRIVHESMHGRKLLTPRATASTN